ncbi:MAG TPA: hypothetical protein PLI07_05730 [Candidatus Hydrogenedentes bacterium]|nr:hypothetical protein [Candidatus Hydrogenedentota bacterium]
MKMEAAHRNTWGGLALPTTAAIMLYAVMAAAQTPFPASVADPILFVVRPQYREDHHNTETMFQKGEINQASFRGGSALKVLDVPTGAARTLLDCPDGIIRDPDVSFDGRTILFSMRREADDDFHIYEIGADGAGLRQLTFARGVTDIDPLYLPDGAIAFSSTREPKYCMCNRHIMANLFRMESDGANIHQIGKSTLFEGHGALLPDGRILYYRWEYIDRNFGDAQGLWTVRPDGTDHALYWGNNTASPARCSMRVPFPAASNSSACSVRATIAPGARWRSWIGGWAWTCARRSCGHGRRTRSTLSETATGTGSISTRSNM